jgi:dihydrodipicolinate synthase/N-acetylneuraminate lyase
MNMECLRGVFPATLSPLDEDMNIKYESLEAFIEFFIEKKVRGLFVLGATGEWPLMRLKRKRELLSFTVKKVG